MLQRATADTARTRRRLPGPKPDFERCWQMDPEQTRNLELEPDVGDVEDPEDRSRRKT